VTYSFGDPSAGVHGLARLGRSEAGASALAVLFEGREPAVFEDELGATEAEPERRWTLRVGDDELAFEALGPPADIEPSEPLARAGGMAGHEQLCRVSGTIRGRELRCLGQRGHTWGEPDWERIDSTRSLAAWLEDGSGLVLNAIRPAGCGGHEDEATWAALFGSAGSLRVDDTRLSTTYDEDGLQRRAGLELWVGEDDVYPRYATGEVVCGSTLELGDLRLDCAFLRWRMDGREGSGRYDILRRVG
jgi:hypothetical protein